MKTSNITPANTSAENNLVESIEPDETPISDPKEKPEIEPDNLPVEEPGVHPLTKPDEDDDDDDDDPFTETEIGDDPDEITKKTTIM